MTENCDRKRNERISNLLDILIYFKIVYNYKRMQELKELIYELGADPY